MECGDGLSRAGVGRVLDLLPLLRRSASLLLKELLSLLFAIEEYFELRADCLYVSCCSALLRMLVALLTSVLLMLAFVE